MGKYNILDADLSAYTVLLADDIELNLVMLRKMLSRYNFKVVTALNGREVLERMSEYKPSLLILDLMMPVLNGYEVISKVRETPEYSSMRIVVMSALNTNDSVERSLSLGANDFIPKPILMERLYDTVSRQFEAVLAMGDVAE
jgi:PleD family two-component response regulator